MLGKDLPYYSTTVDAERSKAEITKLLRKYGSSGIQWTWMSKGGHETEILRFIHECEIKGVKKGIAFEVKVPDMEKTIGYDKKIAPHRNQAMRLVYHVMKNRLAAIDCGLETFEETFLSKIIYKLRDGRPATVGDIVLKQIEDIKPIELIEGKTKNEHRR